MALPVFLTVVLTTSSVAASTFVTVASTPSTVGAIASSAALAAVAAFSSQRPLNSAVIPAAMLAASARSRIPSICLRVMAKTPKPKAPARAAAAGPSGAGIRTRKRSTRRVRRPSSSGTRTNAQLAAKPAIAGIIFPAALRLAGASSIASPASLRARAAATCSSTVFSSAKRTRARPGSSARTTKDVSGEFGTRSPTARCCSSGRIVSTLAPFMSTRS